MSRSTTRPVVRRRRVRSLLLAACVALGGLAVATPPAQAAVIGELFVSPIPGDQDTFMEFNTDAPCPSGTEAVKAKLSGPGITDDLNNNITGNTDYAILQTNASGGRTVSANASLKTVFQRYGLPQTGTYTITVRCQTDDNTTIFGEFAGDIQVVAGSGFNLTYTQSSTAAETAVAVSAGPADPVASGTSSTITATVTPADVPGLVQLERNGNALGAPIRVQAGVASFSIGLSPGVSQLGATFTPDDTNAYAPSTADTVDYLVVPSPVVTGTARVGSSLTCNLNAAAGTTTFAWLVNGAAAAGAAKATVAVPAAWAGKKATCRATTTHAGHALAQTSKALTVAPGVLANTAAPTVSGKAKVGKKLSCKPGRWSAGGTRFAYQWLRNGKAIKKATAASYKVVKADRGRKLSCRVTATAPGYQAASATSTSKAVA